MDVKFVWADKWIGLYHTSLEFEKDELKVYNLSCILTHWHLCIIPCLPIHWVTQSLRNINNG